MKKEQFGTWKVDFSQEVQRVWSGVRSGVGATLLLLILLWPGGQCLGQQTAGAQALVIAGFVYDVVVTNGGTGYSVPPEVSLSGGGGTGATAVVTNMSNGSVVGVKVISAGSGYTSPPAVVIEPPLFDLNDTLVGYWPFEGDVNDASGKGADGAVAGNISFPAGAVGSSIYISGGSYVSFGDPSDGRFDIGLGEDFSAAMWVKNTVPSGLWFPMLLTKDLGYNNSTRVGWAFYFANDISGQVRFDAMVPAGWNGVNSAATPVNDNQWHHIAVTKRGTGIAFYVDGTLKTATTTLNANYSTSIPLRLGRSENTGFANYQGAADELRIYKRALEPREIKAMSGRLPVITHPRPIVVPWGRTATFSTTAIGNGPLSYQWFKGSQSLAWGTNAVLNITNVQAADAGFYSVKVSNPSGTTYSQPAELVVPVINTALNLFPGLMLDGVVGQTYGVQSSTNLSNPSAWVGRTNITLTSQVEMWFDLEPARVCDSQSVGSPARFYRVVPGPISVP